MKARTREVCTREIIRKICVYLIKYANKLKKKCFVDEAEFKSF